ncbi:unnamed protein product [Rotaria socialis]|uniref:DDB1-and CUL4-associated factor 6 n=1 Tax=Rotaria socialis TaxID=392032 RepID=A0A820FTS5_9BILA|nr:unnamed protein product [Rotaria socialis]CAF3306670.1 unnamed protein product [Rotaria socialis]CAF3624872.1 unnamed protein product [Rotaria socialis]CAF4108909.1 unnamed protein product [Rotaria socialis]CAF4269779.1 unnamed protein product [Rotaria socialis]
MSFLSDRQYGLLSHRRLLVKLKNSSSITRRLNIDYSLNVHRGCVNTIGWNELGTTILSGSDDQHLIVTDPFTRKVLTKIHSGHRGNIFSAKFLPETNDRQVISCSGDGVIFHTNFDRPTSTRSVEGCFTCHGSTTAYEVRVIPRTPNIFLSCADDCTIRLYDLRTKSNCMKDDCNDDILIKSNWGITSMDINPINPNEIVCACADSSVRLYDHRKLSTQISSTTSSSCRYESSMNGLISYFILSGRQEQRRSRVTSVVFNQHGTEILASYSSESVFLLDPKQSISQEQIKECLIEHRNKKLTKLSINEKKPTSDKISNDENKTSHIKRLRLRGDWSDTGPDARPSTEEEPTESIINPSESSNEQQSSTTPGHHLQNFFMRRMSDILTQLVTRTTSETGETSPERETTATSNNVETNDNNIQSLSTTENPIVQPPVSMQHSTIANTNHHDEEDNLSNFSSENDGYNNDDDDDDSSIDDAEDFRISSTATTADNVHLSEHTYRTHISTKWDRIKKRRDTDRAYEESLMKNIPSLGLLNSYDGHRNSRTMIKEANFWSDTYVISGSDCGHIFIWNKFNGNIVRIIPADEHVVNCVQPHPLNYPILASSGIDYNIKIFSPLAETPIDDSDRIERTVKRNHAMIEETSSTITVPAAFMLRMLTSIYRLRNQEGSSGIDDDDD